MSNYQENYTAVLIGGSYDLTKMKVSSKMPQMKMVRPIVGKETIYKEIKYDFSGETESGVLIYEWDGQY